MVMADNLLIKKMTTCMTSICRPQLDTTLVWRLEGGDEHILLVNNAMMMATVIRGMLVVVVVIVVVIVMIVVKINNKNNDFDYVAGVDHDDMIWYFAMNYAQMKIPVSL